MILHDTHTHTHMKTVSVLRLVGRQVVIMVVWFYNALSPVFVRVWRTLGYLWRCAASRILPILGRALSAVRWRGGPGTEEEEVEGDTRPLGAPVLEVEEPRSEGQHEAVRAAEEEEWAAFSYPEETGGGGEEFGTEEFDGEEFDTEEYRVQSTDELFCGYDSTWDTEGPQEDPFGRTRRPTRCVSAAETWCAQIRPPGAAAPGGLQGGQACRGVGGDLFMLYVGDYL